MEKEDLSRCKNAFKDTGQRSPTACQQKLKKCPLRSRSTMKTDGNSAQRDTDAHTPSQPRPTPFTPFSESLFCSSTLPSRNLNSTSLIQQYICWNKEHICLPARPRPPLPNTRDSHSSFAAEATLPGPGFSSTPIKLSNCCSLLFPILLQVQFRSSLGYLPLILHSLYCQSWPQAPGLNPQYLDSVSVSSQRWGPRV